MEGYEKAIVDLSKEMNKKLTRIEGLSKNKMSISRIIAYKDQLTTKLDNLKNQTFSDFEAICVNDG